MAKGDIEITSEMIKAGALEVVRYDPRLESLEDAAVNVYEAMERVKRNQITAPLAIDDASWGPAPGTRTITVGSGTMSGGGGGGPAGTSYSSDGSGQAGGAGNVGIVIIEEYH